MSRKQFFPQRENILFVWIYNNQVKSTGSQSAFSLTFREEWEATGRAERLRRPRTRWQRGSVWRGRGSRWLQREYPSNRQGKQAWQQHEEYVRGCFCRSGKDANWLKALNFVREQEWPRLRAVMQEKLARHGTCGEVMQPASEDGECGSACWASLFG